MSKTNKIDINNLDLDCLYTLEEFEFINNQLKTHTLEIEGQPVNLFDFDRNRKLIPMPQSPFSRELGGFNFAVGGVETIRASNVAYITKETKNQLDEFQNWSFKDDPFIS
ncbi:8372_t:CDS:2, partial [Acaulospora morrowiae]